MSLISFADNVPAGTFDVPSLIPLTMLFHRASKDDDSLSVFNSGLSSLLARKIFGSKGSKDDAPRMPLMIFLRWDGQPLFRVVRCIPRWLSLRAGRERLLSLRGHTMEGQPVLLNRQSTLGLPADTLEGCESQSLKVLESSES